MEYQEGIEMEDVEELIGVDIRRKEGKEESEMGDVEELIDDISGISRRNRNGRCGRLDRSGCPYRVGWVVPVSREDNRVSIKTAMSITGYAICFILP